MEASGTSGQGSGSPEPGLVRPATDTDHAAIVALAGSALGWPEGEPNAELFAWKHLRNPFGPSAMWVAEVDGSIVAFRAMLRWEFLIDGGRHRAVRAVDTATHPDHQGRGYFRRLTMHAVESLTDDGVGFVFNTPNANSRPGYLKMGWQVLGRVPVAIRVRSPAALARVLRARVPAAKWSLPSTEGEAAAAVLAEGTALQALLDDQPVMPGLTTTRSLDQLRWRYADGPVKYRALLRTDRVEDGVVVYRCRRRGGAIEATVADVLVPGADPRSARLLIDRVLAATGADYVIHTQRRPFDRGHLRLPAQGPVLTWRALASVDPTPFDRWQLCLGDIELF